MDKSPARTRPDRRAERTRQLLGDALVGLMLEKSYKAITVQDIVERANVGRSTFYARYRDKDDLLMSQLGWMIDQLSQHMAAEQSESALLPSLDLFRHVQTHYPIYRAVMAWGGQGLDQILSAFETLLTTTAEKRLLAKLPSPETLPVPLPVLANYVAGTLLNLLKWWLGNKMPYPPERMDELFRQLVTPTVSAVLDADSGAAAARRASE